MSLSKAEKVEMESQIDSMVHVLSVDGGITSPTIAKFHDALVDLRKEINPESNKDVYELMAEAIWEWMPSDDEPDDLLRKAEAIWEWMPSDDEPDDLLRKAYAIDRAELLNILSAMKRAESTQDWQHVLINVKHLDTIVREQIPDRVMDYIKLQADRDE